MKNKKLFIWAALLSLLAVGLWTYRDASQARDKRRATLWMAYLSGPLSDTLLALEKSSHAAASPGQGEAAQRLQSAGLAAAQLGEQAGADGFFEPLSDALRVHQQLAAWAQALPKSGKREGIASTESLRQQRQLCQSLFQQLSLQRERLFDDHVLRRADALETNAFLYSLREHLEAPAQGSQGQP